MTTTTEAASPSRVSAARLRSLLWERAIRAWLVDLRRRGYSLLTLRDYHGDMAQFAHFIPVEPDQVAPAHIDALVPHLLQLGCGDAVVRRKKAAVAGFIAWKNSAERGGGTGSLVWDRMRGESGEDRILVGLLLFTGVRLSHAGGVEGRDVRLKSESITFRNAWKILPLHPKLRDLFLELRHEFPLATYRPVIPSPRGFSLHERTLHARFRRLMRRIGMPRIRPEDLRREAAAHLLRQGTPDGLVSAFLGRDRGLPVAPRKGRFIDLRCLKPRLDTFLQEVPARSDAVEATAAEGVGWQG